jgi:hypothetical protein
MKKYQVGQKLYWIKYKDNLPQLRVFDLDTIKEDRDGFKYSGEGCSYIREEACFDSCAAAVENGFKLLRELMDE